MNVIFALSNDKFKLLRSQVIQENVTMKSTLKGGHKHMKALNIRGLLEKYPTVFFYANT